MPSSADPAHLSMGTLFKNIICEKRLLTMPCLVWNCPSVCLLEHSIRYASSGQTCLSACVNPGKDCNLGTAYCGTVTTPLLYFTAIS
jgi:hypothetical protein